MDAIIFEKVNKTFKLSRKQRRISNGATMVQACKNLSFSVKNNEIFGLVGPNGAGKTTALRMAATMIKPDSGKINVGGLDISNELGVKKKIAFLTNDLKLDENFTVNYLYEFFASINNVSKEKMNADRKDLFSRFGLEQYSEVKIKNLSQGTRQKAAIAVSLAADAEIIIFDEPTNGLDVITARVVTDFLLELKRRGKTIIISTHIMSLISKLCDRVAIIIDGETVLCEDVKKLSAQHPDLDELFYQLYQNIKVNKQ